MSHSQKALSQPYLGLSYSADEVQAILTRALALRAADQYSAEQLQEMATELSISPDMLAVAEAEWRSQQADIVHHQAAKDQQRRYRRKQWRQYACGSVLMIGIDIATAGTLTWAIFPVLGWGLGLLWGGCDRASSQRSTD